MRVCLQNNPCNEGRRAGNNSYGMRAEEAECIKRRKTLANTCTQLKVVHRQMIVLLL
jgi:hypothetical protein